MIEEKNIVALVGIKPRTLSQESEIILTELTWQMLIEGSLNSPLVSYTT